MKNMIVFFPLPSRQVGSNTVRLGLIFQQDFSFSKISFHFRLQISGQGGQMFDGKDKAVDANFNNGECG